MRNKGLRDPFKKLNQSSKKRVQTLPRTEMPSLTAKPFINEQRTVGSPRLTTANDIINRSTYS